LRILPVRSSRDMKGVISVREELQGRTTAERRAEGLEPSTRYSIQAQILPREGKVEAHIRSARICVNRRDRCDCGRLPAIKSQGDRARRLTDKESKLSVPPFTLHLFRKSHLLSSRSSYVTRRGACAEKPRIVVLPPSPNGRSRLTSVEMTPTSSTGYKRPLSRPERRATSTAWDRPHKQSVRPPERRLRLSSPQTCFLLSERSKRAGPRARMPLLRN